jgi:hypothetical protein
MSSSGRCKTALLHIELSGNPISQEEIEVFRLLKPKISGFLGIFEKDFN